VGQSGIVGKACSLWKKEEPGPLLPAARRNIIPAPNPIAAAIAETISNKPKNPLDEDRRVMG
jgi:hypothetical protein